MKRAIFCEEEPNTLATNHFSQITSHKNAPSFQGSRSHRPLVGAGENEDDFAFGRAFGEVGEQLGGGASAVFLEGFGEFAGDADLALGEDEHGACH